MESVQSLHNPGRPVGVEIVAEIGIVGVARGVEMHHSHRATPGHRAQHRQCRQMIVTHRQRQRALGDIGDAGFDQLQPVEQIDRVDGDVPRGRS